METIHTWRNSSQNNHDSAISLSIVNLAQHSLIFQMEYNIDIYYSKRVSIRAS